MLEAATLPPAPTAEVEASRLAALRALDILDSQPEAIFDALTELAALTFKAPVALVSLVDLDRQWFKSCLGLSVTETERDVAFCNFTIRQPGAFVVLDAMADPHFRHNPLVTGDPKIRFYAGAPLSGPEGHRLGSLCVIDFEPRAEFSEDDRAELEAMAKAVSVAMVLRRDLAELALLERRLLAADETLRASEARLTFMTENSADLILRIDPSSQITWVSKGCRHYGYEVEDVIGTWAGSLVHPDDRNLLAARQPSRFADLEDPEGPNREYRIRRKDGGWVWVEENPSIIRDAKGRAVEIINVLRDISDRKRVEQTAADIQSGMLPPRETLAGLSSRVDVDAVLKPARTIGGDLYDAFMVGPDRLCFLVGDVTGKGVPAALFMALAKALSHSVLARDPDDLGAAMAAIGGELTRSNGEVMAVSMLVGVLDLTSGELRLCNAGLENPILIGADGQVRDLALDGGPPLCVAPGYPYPVETVWLENGAVLVGLTDGVTEAQDPAGDLFGRSRARAALGGGLRHAAALSDLLDGLVAAVRAFEATGEPSDDLAALAIRLRG